jgi:hypothetical protein
VARGADLLVDLETTAETVSSQSMFQFLDLSFAS